MPKMYRSIARFNISSGCAIFWTNTNLYRSPVTRVMVHNQSAIALSRNPDFHKRPTFQRLSFIISDPYWTLEKSYQTFGTEGIRKLDWVTEFWSRPIAAEQALNSQSTN
jgi:hypothetical protein